MKHAGAAETELGQTTWRLTHLGERAVDSEALLEFDLVEKRFAGSGGCNRIFGGIEASGATIKFTGVGSTRMACLADGVMENEAAFIAALQKATSFRIADGKLKLMNGRRVLAKFKAADAETETATSDLEAKKWMLASIKGTAVRELEEAAFLVFDREKASAGGNSGCNAFGGSYESKRSTIRIFDMVSTMRACIEDDRMDIERGLLGGLQGANRFEIRDGQLHLFNGETELLVFTGTGK